MTAIYSLSHPITREVRYVGKTKLPLCQRLQLHLSEARYKERAHYRKNRWVAALLKQGLEPIIRLVQIVLHGERWEDCEILWISKYRKQFPGVMVNHYGGGGQAGPPTGRIVSEETKQKIRNTLKGRITRRNPYTPTAETRKRISEANSRRRSSDETKRKISALHKGRIKSDQERRNISEGRKRNMATEEGRKKMAYFRTAGTTRLRIDAMARRVCRAMKLCMAA
jgi:NUMOD3 motif-containing protein